MGVALEADSKVEVPPHLEEDLVALAPRAHKVGAPPRLGEAAAVALVEVGNNPRAALDLPHHRRLVAPLPALEEDQVETVTKVATRSRAALWFFFCLAFWLNKSLSSSIT